MFPRVTLDQWRVFHAIIDAGGFAQAAAALHRSQSSVSYAARKLQQTLGVELFEIIGRKAELTEAGQIFLERSRGLLDQAINLEDAARQMRAGREPVIRLAVENVLPNQVIFESLRRFEPQSQGTRIMLREEVLSGVADALEEDEVDIAISPLEPDGYLFETLTQIEFVAVAHHEHPLHHLQPQPYGVDMLRQSVHIVINDTGHERRDAGWLQAENRWTVGSFATAVDMVVNGLGFAWLPHALITTEMRSGLLLPLPLEQGVRHEVSVNLIYGNRRESGPALKQWVELLRKVVAEQYLQVS